MRNPQSYPQASLNTINDLAPRNQFNIIYYMRTSERTLSVRANLLKTNNKIQTTPNGVSC
jgi:hypothetical protein